MKKFAGLSAKIKALPFTPPGTQDIACLSLAGWYVYVIFPSFYSFFSVFSSVNSISPYRKSMCQTGDFDFRPLNACNISG